MGRRDRNKKKRPRRASRAKGARRAIAPASAGAEAVSASPKSAYASEPDRRCSPRIALDVDIGLASDSHFFSDLSGDVSEGGLFVQTYRDLPVGSDVALDFELPGGRVTTHGRVCWHRAESETAPAGVGVTFAELPEDARAIIHQFCAARAPLYYEIEPANEPPLR
jgi:uncharacterized protein (TIGR02266 family)